MSTERRIGRYLGTPCTVPGSRNYSPSIAFRRVSYGIRISTRGVHNGSELLKSRRRPFAQTGTVQG